MDLQCPSCHHTSGSLFLKAKDFLSSLRQVVTSGTITLSYAPDLCSLPNQKSNYSNRLQADLDTLQKSVPGKLPDSTQCFKQTTQECAGTLRSCFDLASRPAFSSVSRWLAQARRMRNREREVGRETRMEGVLSAKQTKDLLGPNSEDHGGPRGTWRLRLSELQRGLFCAGKYTVHSH